MNHIMTERLPFPQMKPLIPAILLAAIPFPATCAAEPDAATPEISLQGKGFSLTASRPQILILEGQETPPVSLVPQGTAAVKECVRQTPAGPAKATTYEWKDDRGYVFSRTISRLEKSTGITLQMSFENRSQRPVNLREFQLCQASGSGVKVAGKPADWFLSTLDSHNSAVGGFQPSGDLGKDGESKFLDTVTLYTENGAKGLILGAVGPAVSDVYFRCPVTKGAMGLEIVSEMNDVVVDPGETRCSEEVLVLAGPHEIAVPTLFRWLAATHGSRTARGPLAGWCSWYNGIGTKVNGKIIDGICSAAGTGPDKLPLQVIQIDDGWQKAYGNWEANPAKFPNGMKPVADKIRATGALPGVWLCPVRTSQAGAHPDGTANEYQDASHPAVRAFIRAALQARVAEGFRYFKLDFLWIKHLETRYDKKKTRLQIRRDLYQLYRESIGEDAYLDACVGGFNRACYGYADAARTGTDTMKSMGKLYVGCSIANSINALGSTADANGILFANDPDVAYVDFGKNELLRTWYCHVGLLGGLMLTSEPLDRLEPSALHNFEALMPPAPDKGRAFDGQTDPWHRRFGFIAKRPWGNFASVLLWNPEDKPADVALKGVPLEEIGRKFHIWSYWDEKYLGVGDGSFVAKALPKYAPALLRLTPATGNGPVLVGSTLHISMGSAEIKDITTEPTGMTIMLTDAGARDGKLYVHSDKPLSLQSAKGCKASVTPAGNTIYRVTVNGRQRNAPNAISMTCQSAR